MTTRAATLRASSSRQVRERGYAASMPLHGLSGASVKARFQKAGSEKRACKGIDVDGRLCLIKVEGADEVNVLPGIRGDALDDLGCLVVAGGALLFVNAR